MNYRKQIFDMLCVDPDETFTVLYNTEGEIFKMRTCRPKIDDDSEVAVSHHLDEDLSGWIRCGEDQEWEREPHLLNRILSGQYIIQRSPKRREEKLALAYAKACGYQWMAKNPDGATVAYVEAPIKDQNGFWQSGGMKLLIQVPIRFLTGMEDEPWPIGEEDLNHAEVSSR